MVIYKITNLVNGKIYIGQTTRKIKERWYCHSRQNHTKTAINSAIKKYNKNNFIIEEIYYAFDIEELNRSEKWFIQSYNCLAPNGYNLDTGGNNKKASKELKKKLSKAKLGKKYGPRKEGAGDNISVGKGCSPFKVYKKDTLEYIGTWTNRTKCARELYINDSKVCACVRGERPQHAGYIFIKE